MRPQVQLQQARGPVLLPLPASLLQRPQPAAQRGRRASAEVKAAGMLSGSALVSELHQQNLGRMHVAPLLEKDRARYPCCCYS